MRLRSRCARVAWGAVTVVLAGCGHRELRSRELQSDLRAIGATAAEADLFAGFVLEHHATGHYAAGHSEYLEKETRKLADKLSRSPTSSPLQGLKDSIQGLATELADALKETTSATPDQPGAWARLRERSITIHQRAGRAHPRRGP